MVTWAEVYATCALGARAVDRAAMTVACGLVLVLFVVFVWQATRDGMDRRRGRRISGGR